MTRMKLITNEMTVRYTDVSAFRARTPTRNCPKY